jgi:RNA polymerase sigma-70 factor (ECF subfamily)
VTDWESIVSQHGPLAYGVAWRILGHAADAEDVVQEVFLEVYRHGQADRIVNWGAVLRRVTTYRALDRRRSRRPAADVCGLAIADATAGPEEEVAGRELAERLRQALAALPPREGAVFALRHFEELSYDQIAESLDVSRQAVASALHKARVKLETALCASEERPSTQKKTGRVTYERA